MAYKFSEPQKANLQKVWLECDGQERLANNFTTELAYFMEHCPELIADGNKKIETEQSRNYSTLEKHCDKLLKTLESIPELERLNLLSLREQRPEYDGKSIPLCDPLEYVRALQALAADQSHNLKRYAKHERQLDQLRTHLNRHPPLRDISRSKFIELAGELWPDIKYDSFLKAYRPRKK